MYYPAGYPSINGLSCRWTLTAPFGQVSCSMLTRLSVVTFKGNCKRDLTDPASVKGNDIFNFILQQVLITFNTFEVVCADSVVLTDGILTSGILCRPDISLASEFSYISNSNSMNVQMNSVGAKVWHGFSATFRFTCKLNTQQNL